VKVLALLLALVSAGLAQAQTPRPKETLLQKLLRIAGLTAAPSQMRAPGDLQPGDIWITEIGPSARRALTQGGTYHSPVFEPGGTSAVYALRDDVVVRIPLAGGVPEDRGRVPQAMKLVGFDGTDELVVLIEPELRASPLVVLSLKSARLNPLPYDPESPEEQRVLAFVRGGERVYGDTRVYTRTESRRGLSRTIEWMDVYLARGAAAPLNVSMCDGTDCGEPALSQDGQRVAYVRSSQR
jgi:hypothetical protein